MLQIYQVKLMMEHVVGQPHRNQISMMC